MHLQRLLLIRRFFSTLAFFSMQTVFFIYLQKKGLSNAEIAFSLSLLFFCNQALAILAGIWGDRYGLAKMMLLGCLLDVCAYAFFLSADHYAILLLATVCFGLGSCLFSTNAKACLLALAGEEYAEKTRLQGKYLQVTSMSSMVAPLLVIPFIKFDQIALLIWVCFAIEASLFVLMVKPFYQIQTAQTLVKFRLGQIKQILTKEFLFVHLMLFIPLSIATSFFVIFPFLFDNKLAMPEHSPIALFVNGLLTVLLQSYFSRKINLNAKQTVWVAPILAAAMIVPWFITLHYISLFSAYLYLVIFTVVEVYALTAMVNLLVKFDNGVNRGFIFGASRLLLSIATVIVMNLIPHLFLV
ncbi:MFS transporter [[Haemophilus] ducreyi]|uniref:MFS transporter n=1 Tax=Haemophilus ducreyi TaxID=730 RepID=UPI000655FCB4|nr:MFS transporter [[Haemophilus] ducreyi]AKO44758.1 ABC transporter permease [[Haemophilus] ducreyi]AKO46165.1 ABC transporter permease [[Haemophilus] ducreyi]AKO47505.1 ABC transporter permease [[Haemophilus] ducreyi]AKO48890.1 ABC transporter permease [[Haemophilus] ducreyi]ANF68174.1 ABC transporter permease [[Haemophilus] ducreyi]